MHRMLAGIGDMPTWRFVLLLVAIFATATAWSFSLGTSHPPEPADPWAPQTIAPPVTTEVP